MTGTDFGFKDGIRDNKNIAPRAGFTYNVGGNERPRDPRRHRALLHDARVEHDLQPADLQPDGHRGVPAAGQRQVSRRIALDHQPGVRRHDLRAGEGGRAARSRRASSAPTTRTRTPGRAASASRSRSTR